MVSAQRAALALAQRAIPTFPCAPGAKRPLTPRGLHDASTDPRVINGWFRRAPDANIGIPMGFRSGLFAIDIDQHGADGHETLRALEQTLGALPETLAASTPSGGEHRYFRMPDRELRNTAGALGPGIDTRGEGGYVLCAPSIVDSRPYCWTVRAQPAALSGAWLEALTPRARPSAPVEPWTPRDDREQSRAVAWCTRALQEEARSLADAPAGTRNDRLWRAAAALGGLIHLGAIDAADVRRALAWACSQWPERTPHKDAATLENGIAFGRARPRQIHLGDDHRAA
jgi:Bifunctional DNA primase/polymerase, N-terminal